MVKGCAYGNVNRQMVIDLRGDIKDIKDRFACFEKKFDEKITKVSNHLSSRIPPWATVVISVLTAIVGALLTKISA